MHDVMKAALEFGFKSYDLGKGGYLYKYDFATQDSIMFNIAVNKYSSKLAFLDSSLNIIRKILRKLKIK